MTELSPHKTSEMQGSHSTEIIAGLSSQASIILDSFGHKPLPTSTTFHRPNPDFMRVMSHINVIDPRIRQLNPRLLETTLPDGTKEFEMETPRKVVTEAGTFNGTITDRWSDRASIVTSQERARDITGKTLELKEPVVTEDESELEKVRQRMDQHFEPLSKASQKQMEAIKRRVQRRQSRRRLLGKVGLEKLIK